MEEDYTALHAPNVTHLEDEVATGHARMQSETPRAWRFYLSCHPVAGAEQLPADDQFRLCRWEGLG